MKWALQPTARGSRVPRGCGGAKLATLRYGLSMTDHNVIAGEVQQAAAQLESLFGEAVANTAENIEAWVELERAEKAGQALDARPMGLAQQRARVRAAHKAGVEQALDLFDREFGLLQVAIALESLSHRALSNVASSALMELYAARGGKVP